MKQNVLLKPKTRLSIEERVSRLLSELGNPEPPLDLSAVRELLELDLNYYQSDDEGLLKEVTHKLKVAGRQVLRRPSRVLDAVKKFDLRALYVPDHRKILIDEVVPKAKHRWLEAHEIGHNILPWHASCMHGDQQHIIRPGAHPKIEAEANHAAGRLLFLGDQFVKDANDCAIEFDSVRQLKGRFGNTLSTTLWRFIEQAHSHVPLFGIIGDHPCERYSIVSGEPREVLRYFISSPGFQLHFAQMGTDTIQAAICSGSRAARGGIVNEGEFHLSDLNGERHLFSFETFFNRYDALTLGRHLKKVD